MITIYGVAVKPIIILIVVDARHGSCGGTIYLCCINVIKYVGQIGPRRQVPDDATILAHIMRCIINRALEICISDVTARHLSN